MSGPTGVCVRLSSRSCMPGSCLFPPLLSSLVCTAAETDQLRVMQHPLLQQHNVVLHNNEAMSQCCHREQQDQGISLNFRPLDKAALREARAPYVPETPHTEAGTNRGLQTAPGCDAHPQQVCVVMGTDVLLCPECQRVPRGFQPYVPG